MELITRCQSKQELHDWILEHLKLDIPQTSLCPHHDAPMDYLWKSYNEPGQDMIVWAPRGGGKTTLGAVATLLELLHKPNCQVRILGGSLEQSLRMWEHLLPMAEEVAGEELSEDRSRTRKLKMKNGSAAAVLTQSQRCVRGQRVQKLRCDEVELFDREVWSAAQLVTRSRTADELDPEVRHRWPQGYRARIEALSTMHEPYGLMQELVESASGCGRDVIRWCLLDVLEKCPHERTCKSCSLFDECQGKAKYASGFFRIDDAIAMKQRVCKDTWEAEMLCLRPSRKSAVFAPFKPARHVSEQAWWPMNADVHRTLAIDFGYTHPAVCLWILHDRQNRAFVLDELHITQKTVEQFAALIRARESQHGVFDSVICDVAGSQQNRQTSKTDIQVLRECGFQISCRRSSIHEGLDLVRAALDPAVGGEPRLRVHPRCRNLIRSMELYHYGPDGKPDKDGVSDHCCDALRYFYVLRQTSHCASGVC